MNNIEAIEKEKKYWKAKLDATPPSSISAYAYCDGMYDGLKLALDINNRPPNKKVEALCAKEWVCTACYTPNTKLRKFCRVCSAPAQDLT